MTAAGGTVPPREIRLSADKTTLQITFASGQAARLTAELLRVESPSAEVQGHGEGQKTTPSGKRNITITAIAPVGNYAVRITFDDGHDTGIYSWSLLKDYAARQDHLIADYLERLDSLGLSRDA